jgi:RNA polymerase sigma-70 factor (ECF subfamily)
VARESYGRLLAYLAARWRDVAAAEDALGAAFLAALETWPRDGVPDRPEAWLLAAARRRLVACSAAWASRARSTISPAGRPGRRVVDGGRGAHTGLPPFTR